jgi:2,4-dienoyl-CoA reductase-like NADH-dependent reductase (Old Yellow Enzyme family)/thioredoxin reductase
MRPGETKYPHIFSPGKIGKLTTKNRIKYNATVTNFCYRDGFVSKTEIDYLEAQARGGPGIVSAQGAYTDAKGEQKGYPNQMAIYDDKFIPGIAKIADVIHKNGALALFQLMPCGRYGGVELNYSKGPSVVPQFVRYYKDMAEMTVEEIKIAEQECIDAARRAAEAGYDMVEMGGHVGYLFADFVSKFTNKRTDEYGGDARGRMKFNTDIIKGIKKELGQDYPVGIRLSIEENLLAQGGNTQEESLEAMLLAEEAGADYMSVTVGWHEAPSPTIHRVVPMGEYLPLVKKVKDALKIPVSHAYRQFIPDIPEKAMADGILDFWEMCRPMMVEPNLPNLVAEDRQQDIRPCIGCNVCIARLARVEPLTCPIRPNMGHEGERIWGYYGFPKAPERKKVAIIGAGPAGMQAGAVAAEKGHEVTIYEKNDHVGGQLFSAAQGVNGDEELIRMVNYLKAQCDKHGVEFKLGQAMNAETAKDLDVDVLIIATGAVADKSLKGADKANVASCTDVLEGKVQPGKRVAIIGGKGRALQTAQAIVAKNPDCKITVICEEKYTCSDVQFSYQWIYKIMSMQHGLELIKNAKPVEITDQGVIIDLSGEKGKLIEADTVVIAKMVPNRELAYDSYKAKDVNMIGDCIQVRRLFAAVHDGYKMGMRVDFEPFARVTVEKVQAKGKKE